MDENIESMVYTVKELQKILKLGKNTVYELVSQPDFPTIKLGKKYLIPKKSLEEWMKRHLYKEYLM